MSKKDWGIEGQEGQARTIRVFAELGLALAGQYHMTLLCLGRGRTTSPALTGNRTYYV